MTTLSTTPVRQRRIEDMNARKLSTGTQKCHIRSCRRFAAFLERSPNTASPEDIRRFSRLFHEAVAAAGITKPVTLHSLRHSPHGELVEPCHAPA